MLRITRSAAVLLIATTAVFASRLPFIATGFGSEPDSYLLSIAANKIASTGTYTASRMPGYPVPELALSRIIHLGPLASNLISVVLSAIDFLLLALILRKWKIPHSLLVSLAFAFTPIVYVNSTSTMDYVWALTFVLVSVILVQRSRLLLAGVALGVAAGCRMPSVLMTIPILVYWIMEHRRSPRCPREIILFLSGVTAAGLLCFLPVLLRYGFGFLSVAAGYPRLLRILANLSARLWGVIGCIAFLILVPYLRKGLGACRQAMRTPTEAPVVFFMITAILIHGIVFVLIPHEAAYLIPAVPWILALTARFFPQRAPVRIALVLLIVSPFLLSADKGGFEWYGPIFRDHRNRVSRAAETDDIVGRAGELEEKTLVVAGYMWPLLHHRVRSDRVGNTRFVEKIRSIEEFADYVNQGYRIYYLQDMDRYMKLAFGVEIAALGAQPFQPRFVRPQ